MAKKPPPITATQTKAQITSAAEAQVQAELQGQISPLEGRVGSLETDRDRALKDIAAMFGNIQPSVDAAAQNVQASYNQATAAQSNIFAAANQRMSELRQSRAQEAQAMAQQMGGPVAIGEFTESVTPHQTALAQLGAGSMLHGLAYAQAGVQQANAFAGNVFPLIRTEETAKGRQYYEDQIKTIEDEITDLKQTKTSKVNAKANEMLVREREFALQKSQQALEKLKANRDWKATIRTLKNDEARLDMAEEQFALQQAGVTGEYKGKPTLAAKQLTAEEKRSAAAMGLSEREFQLRKAELTKSATLKNKQLAAAQRATWAEYLDAAVNPQPGKTVTTTRAVPVPPELAIQGKGGNVYKDASSPTGYSKLVKTEDTVTTQPITNPHALVEFLMSHNVPKKIAVNMVKNRFRLPSNWKYYEQGPGTDDRKGNDPRR
jgi:hypothetical protein